MAARMAHLLDGTAAAQRLLLCDAAITSLLLLAPQPRGELLATLRVRRPLCPARAEKTLLVHRSRDRRSWKDVVAAM